MDRVWYHIDVNSAFLGWEAAYRVCILGDQLDLRAIPAVIGGNEKDRHGIVLAKSLPAKKYRIQTGEPLITARNKCPGLVVIQPNYELYVSCSKAMIQLVRNYTPEIHQYSIDEVFCDMSGSTTLFASPVMLAEQLRQEIKETLGFTVNIGVSSNKILAKMASELKKPDRVHTLFPEEIQTKMWPLPVSDLFYVGRATTKKLAALGIRTIGELANADPVMLKEHLNKHGEVIQHYANGIDHSPFLKMQSENKGYGNSITVPCDIINTESAKQVLLSLTETVCARLRADGMKVGCIGVSLVDDEFQHYSRQLSISSVTDTTLEIYQVVCQVFDLLWVGFSIRQLGVFTSKVTHDTAYQYNLFDRDKYEAFSKLDSAVDKIRARYGEDAVMRASFLGHQIAHMSGGIDRVKRTGMTKGI